MSNAYQSRKLTQLTLALALTVAAGLAQANLITNGSFEIGVSPPGGGFNTLGVGNTNITGWSIGGASIDWIGGYWVASDGVRSIDLNGGGGGATLSQTFATIAGENYLLTFDMAGNTDSGPTVKMLDVLIDNMAEGSFSFDTTGFTRSSMGWITYNLSFTAAGASTTLAFQSTIGGAFGPALDNVIVTVPEPTSLALIGIGLLGFGLHRRRSSI